ncbi:MAG: beta-glucuronidase [Prevotellaceae bacterium]|jgi:hypothetical protein|nr:beta-glucuronidase [Prevotellaceae bacterium]
MYRKHILHLALLLLVVGAFAQGNIVDLSGPWEFKIDRDDKGATEKWFNNRFDDYINLPGSMPENLLGDIPNLATRWTGSLYDSSFYRDPRYEKYRQPGNIKFPFFLTPDRHYVGVAWYQKEVSIPKSWAGKQVFLRLERPHIVTRVWVDGNEVGAYSAFCTPHVFDLSRWMKPGKQCRISVSVDNRLTEAINVGPDSHSITDQTQGNWNGIVGALQLEAKDPVHFDDIQVYPNLAAKQAVVKITLNKEASGSITLSAKSFNSKLTHEALAVTQAFGATGKTREVELALKLGDGMQTWDEFSPTLYTLHAELSSGKAKDSRDVQFGMREVSIEGKYFYINGRKIMLRGTVENCNFPLTGYAPMDVAAWERVFRICKNHGLNHMRFHSYCPPEAAFVAADLTGFYLQPEGPSWPNHGSSLGDGRPIDTFLLDETVRLTKAYGSYASFCMLSSGNEPRGRWVPWVSRFVSYWKEKDPRRVYTGASVGQGWAWQPASQYHVKAGARGLAWGQRPETRSDYRGRIDTIQQPYVSHETGQWCVFPDFDEMKKYTGVNKAKNFELFREDLADHDMADLGHDFMMASGKLQALCYKHEIEKTLRTPGYAGFQLLALNDYSGQGSALVGVLNVFFDEKEYTTASEFRKFCSSTVPLARLDRFVFRSADTLKADVEVAHFGAAPLQNVQASWAICSEHGVPLAEGKLARQDIPIGSCIPWGSVKAPLNLVSKASKLTFRVSIDGTEFTNDWDFWVYPDVKPTSGESGVYICEQLDDRALDTLRQGGRVLLLAAGKVEYGKDIVQHLLPVFWNTSWFKMRPPHTTGILVNPRHPLFADFPTDYHSNLQWWELVHRAQVMQLTDFPKGFQPLVQSIDTWFLNRKIGMLFEANVSGGKLVVCSMDIQSSLDERIVARQLRSSIIGYMQSGKFRPAHQVALTDVQNLFTKEADRVKTYTTDAPDELKN